MNERERLIELLEKAEEKAEAYLRENDYTYRIPTLKEICGVYADHLLANGVIVPPCKVGDKIFFIVNMSEHLAFNDFVTDDTVTKIGVTTKGILHEKGVDFTDFGKTVFLTREEAEAALKERGEE